MGKVTLLFICLSLTSSCVAGNIGAMQVQLTRAIHIDQDDFQITQALTSSTVSHIACGAKFMIARGEGYLTNENGFHFDEDTTQCTIGTVSFPVEELDQDAIMVHGISKNPDVKC